MNVQKYAERHPEKQREIKRNQKRAERARKKQEQEVLIPLSGNRGGR